MRIPVLDLAAEYASLRAEIDAALARIVDHTAFVGGAEVQAFEREFAAYLGAGHAHGVANGTDALELALEALDVGPGDAVLTVPFTFAAPLEAIVRRGATPVLVDIDEHFTLDVDAAAQVLRQRPIKAIVAVHLYGQPADLDRLLPLARAHGAALIEDAAQAHGAWCTVGGTRRRAGTIGDVGCFSFYPTKNLGAMGDAGAVTTNRDDLAERLRLLANHGGRARYEHVIANGRNSRLDALHAAVLRIKLPHLDAWNTARRARAAQYAAALHGLPLRLPSARPGSEAVYHQYAVRSPQRDRLAARLAERGIGTAIHYPRPLHVQDGFRALGYGPGAFPVAERCAAEVLSLPMSPFLAVEQAMEVAAAVRLSLAD
ncbi:MAG: DegT/DnrJ/EryC1/StrS family aminotransferase [Candidatus Binatia bacterium]